MNDSSFPKIYDIKKIYTDYDFNFITIFEDLNLNETFLICIAKNIITIYIFEKEEEKLIQFITKDINYIINSFINFDHEYFFILTDNILFLYKYSSNTEFFYEISKYNSKLYFLKIFELNNNNFLLLHDEGVLLIEYFKKENKIQVKSNYIYNNNNEMIDYAFGLNSKKLKFKNKINDLIIFKYNDITFVNYINFKIKKKLLNENCILPKDYEPKYFIIDNNKNLVGFNSKSYYFFIIDVYKREIPFKFIYPGTLYYSIYSMEKLSDNKFICFYKIKGCYSSNYEVSFCSLFKDDKKFDEMFHFNDKLNIYETKIICTSINYIKNYIFCQPYKMNCIYLIHLEN